MSESSCTSDVKDVSAFNNFADLADAAMITAAGQILLRHVQRRVISALETAGFRAASWAHRPYLNSSKVRVLRESLQVVDPLTEAVFDLQLEFMLTQISSVTRLRLDCTARTLPGGKCLTEAEIVNLHWGSLDLVEIENALHKAFHELVAPEGLNDDAFAGLVNNLTYSLAP